MNIEQIREYTLSLPGVTEDQAFGEDILNFRLEGKIFQIPDIGLLFWLICIGRDKLIVIGHFAYMGCIRIH